MIGRLRGRVDGRGENWVLVDVGGVGYMVEGSARLLDGCPPDGEAVSLAIETYVREDQFRLFGFLSEEERSWFKLLMGVQGVGVKVAISKTSVSTWLYRKRVPSTIFSLLSTNCVDISVEWVEVGCCCISVCCDTSRSYSSGGCRGI